MRLGLTLSAIDNTLYDAFGQRQVSTIYNALNQYHVVMEVAPRYWQDPRTLDKSMSRRPAPIATGAQQTGFAAGNYVSSTGAAEHCGLDRRRFGAQSRDQRARGERPHRPPRPARRSRPRSRRWFRSRPSPNSRRATRRSASIIRDCSRRLDDLVQPRRGPVAERGQDRDRQRDRAHRHAVDGPRRLRRHRRDLPAIAVEHAASVRRRAARRSISCSAILYESLIHPITILSTLFSASVGAALALWLFDTQFTIIAAIGVLLLDRHRQEERDHDDRFRARGGARPGATPREAIEEACLLRFRPIMMTTFAALFGALPLAFGTGEGSELRHPLGITIVGGLIVSQALTLYTTPVVFIYLDNFGKWLAGLWRRYYLRAGSAPMAGAR